MIEMMMKEEEEEDCLSFILQFTFNSQFQAPLSLSAMYSFPFLSLYSAQLNSFFNDDDRLVTTSFLLQLLCVGEFVWVIELLYDDVELESSSSQFFYSNGEFMTVY